LGGYFYGLAEGKHALPANFQLQDPEGTVLAKHIKQSTSTVSITAERDGRHQYCFSNLMSSVSDKYVRLVIPLAIHLQRSDIVDLLASTCMGFSTWGKTVCICSYYSRLAKTQKHAALPPDDVVAPIEREIRSLANSLTSVKDEQEYIVIRERTHRNTAESTNARVKWWSVLQAFVLFSVVAWQVYYLKVSSLDSVNMHWLMNALYFQSFFEIKRVI
jgi:p24 family protein beta-1